jgi:hypothetical protein
MPGKMVLQLAPGPQSVLALHLSAQYLLPEAPSWSRHWGAALQPSGTSWGQAIPAHFGEHTAPATPWMRTATSSSSQPSSGLP